MLEVYLVTLFTRQVPFIFTRQVPCIFVQVYRHPKRKFALPEHAFRIMYARPRAFLVVKTTFTISQHIFTGFFSYYDELVHNPFPFVIRHNLKPTCFFTRLCSFPPSPMPTSPLFHEYLTLLYASENKLSPLLPSLSPLNKNINLPSPLTFTPHDAFLIVDMQNDFMPGGSLAIPEAHEIVDLIMELSEKAIDSGAHVVATKDYHPQDHCSFVNHGGGFPPHCVQGSYGAEFTKPLGIKLQALRAQAPRHVVVVHKGIHTDMDSFGAFPYTEALVKRGEWQRVLPRRKNGSLEWTGSFVLQCSAGGDNVNAPPDVCAVLERVSLAEFFRKEKLRRVYVCGVALDFCVMDTALTIAAAGYEVCIVLDATRAAYSPQNGKYGSGFLSHPRVLLDLAKEYNISFRFATHQEYNDTENLQRE